MVENKKKDFLGFDIGIQEWVIGTFSQNGSANEVRKLYGAEILAKMDFGVTLNKKMEYEIILESNIPIKLIEYPNGRLERPHSVYIKKI
jgi:hypothetical protein